MKPPPRPPVLAAHLPSDLIARLAALRSMDDLIALLQEQPPLAPYIRLILLEMLAATANDE